MNPAGWSAVREAPAWLRALQPATTGLLGQEGLKLWTSGKAAVGIRAGGIVYPVFPEPLSAEQMAGIRMLFDQVTDAWCLMGPESWVAAAEPLMPESLLQHRIEYEFLYRPAVDCPVPAGSGVPRRAETSDGNALFPLQEGYEKEEVLFQPSDFQALASRLHLGKSLRNQEIVALWEDGKPVAKAGTNALTEAWAQIGGVYTRPDRRGHGLQKRLMAFLLQRLAHQGRSSCLFVKKSNTAALALYRGLGFANAIGYLITYGLRL